MLVMFMSVGSKRHIIYICAGLLDHSFRILLLSTFVSSAKEYEAY